MHAPTALLAPLAVLAILTLAAVVLARRDQARALGELRSRWGHPPDRQGGARGVASYDQLLSQEDGQERSFRLDDRTWSDLDLDAVFACLDRCTSPIGSQVLYRALRCADEEGVSLLRDRALADALSTDAARREAVQLCLRHAGDPRAARIADILWRELPPVPRLALIAPLFGVAAIGLPVLVGLGLASPVLLLVLFAANTVLHFVHRHRVDALPLAQLGGLVRAGSRLARLDDDRLMPLTAVVAPAASAARRLERLLAPLQTDDGLGLLQYIKIYLLLDVMAYGAVASQVRRRLPELRALFLALGHADSLLAVASFRVEHGRTCRPEFTAEPQRWCVSAVWHPLVKTPVPNDYKPDPRAAVITGSNMAGKTTFLKAMSINAVLAGSLDIVCADEWVMPPLEVLTSIGRADNLITGHSYYLDEVESILRLVRAAETDRMHLLIADEVFRGTNPQERVAAACEVLRHLAAGRHLVLAATHDHELVGLLADLYGCYHFAETLGEHGLSFDYRLRPGPATTRNAIALLEHMGYPSDLVERARRLARREA